MQSVACASRAYRGRTAAETGCLSDGDVSYARYETRFDLGFAADGRVEVMGSPTFVPNPALRGTAWERFKSHVSWWRLELSRRSHRIPAGLVELRNAFIDDLHDTAGGP